MYLLGYDVGSSSIKAALVEVSSGQTKAIVQSPKTEMAIQAPQPGWAEQDPESWWENICLATKELLAETGLSPEAIQGIGIAYQMHGLVLVDKAHQVLRPSIIWCDSRAVAIGDKAAESIGREACFRHLLNSPGNFTASKLKWVKDNQPDIFSRIHKIMLPGDYISARLTGELLTTISGLSEGILWDFVESEPAKLVLEEYGIPPDFIPQVQGSFSPQGTLTLEAAQATGLKAGTPVTYRAGDQPNNALSLNVLEPGEVAATGGTSGVVYGVVDRAISDPLSRVNSFAHVNHKPEQPRIGILLCINGAGIQYSWAKQQMARDSLSYPEMEKLASSVPIGSEGLRILPFGNGAERMLGNQDLGAQVHNLQFNRHDRTHFFRAALEGVAFSFVYGMEALRDLGLDVQVIRVGNDNLFQSTIFSSTISHLMGSRIEVLDTTGAVGAAKASGVANGIYGSIREATQGNRIVRSYEPINGKSTDYRQAFEHWKEELEKTIHQPKS